MTRGLREAALTDGTPSIGGQGPFGEGGHQ